MAFWSSPDDTLLDLVTEKAEQDPGNAESFAALADLREASRQGLAISPQEAARANGFVRVASLKGYITDIGVALDPTFLSDKNNFYAWLDRHPKFCTYDRRRIPGNPNSVTFSDGKVVL